MAEASTTGHPQDDPTGSSVPDDGNDPEPEHDQCGLEGRDGTEGVARSDPPASTVLPATPGSVHAARSWVRDNLERSHVDSGVLERAELLVSEIATNVVRHTASTQFELRLVTSPAVEISVHDQDRAGNQRLLHPTPDEGHGRGLAIVEALSHAWGIHRSPTGKIVWFQLGPPLPLP